MALNRKPSSGKIPASTSSRKMASLQGKSIHPETRGPLTAKELRIKRKELAGKLASLSSKYRSRALTLDWKLFWNESRRANYDELIKRFDLPLSRLNSLHQLQEKPALWSTSEAKKQLVALSEPVQKQVSQKLVAWGKNAEPKFVIQALIDIELGVCHNFC